MSSNSDDVDVMRRLVVSIDKKAVATNSAYFRRHAHFLMDAFERTFHESAVGGTDRYVFPSAPAKCLEAILLPGLDAMPSRSVIRGSASAAALRN